MITHVLDTSAILAHYFEETGAEEVNQLLQDHAGTIGLCVVSWPELMTRLGAILGDPVETSHAFRLYTEVVTAPLPVTVEVARKAIQLRELAGSRLPLVDSLIAAAASQEQATLVHRDAHFDGIPGSHLRQNNLGPRASRSRGESKRPRAGS